MRWLLPIFLAAAVLGMHHLPATDEHRSEVGHHTSPSAAPLAGGSVEPSARAGPAEHCCPPQSPIPATGRDDAPGGHGHDLLHLCLAVLMALVWGLSMGRRHLSGLGVAGSSAISSLARGAAGAAARPPPVSRRLAALGVLRL